jgi:hypothetical protein
MRSGRLVETADRHLPRRTGANGGASMTDKNNTKKLSDVPSSLVHSLAGENDVAAALVRLLS